MDNLFIDIGSTNIKWQKGNEKVRSVPFPPPKINDGLLFEVPADKIIDILFKIIDGSGSKALFISTQMHGYVLLGEREERLTDYISWQDTRSSGTSLPFDLPPESGSSIKANLPRAGVYSMLSQNPGLSRRIKQFCTLGSYIALKLTGKNITHITDAAASGYYNAQTAGILNEYDYSLPIAKKDISIAGYYGDIAVYTPVGDQQSAVLGCGAAYDEYIMNLGTAGQLCCINRDFVAGKFESRPYFGSETLCTVTNLMGGKGITQNPNDWTQKFCRDYSEAISLLPQRKAVLVTGGAVKFYKKQLIGVLDKMGIDYRFDEGSEALKGLMLLAEKAL